MGQHSDLIAADLDGIDPQETAGHLRAIAALTRDQLRGMLGWAQQEQDADVYRVTYELVYQSRPADSEVLMSLMGRRAYFAASFTDPDPAARVEVTSTCDVPDCGEFTYTDNPEALREYGKRCRCDKHEVDEWAEANRDYLAEWVAENAADCAGAPGGCTHERPAPGATTKRTTTS